MCDGENEWLKEADTSTVEDLDKDGVTETITVLLIDPVPAKCVCDGECSAVGVDVTVAVDDDPVVQVALQLPERVMVWDWSDGVNCALIDDRLAVRDSVSVRTAVILCVNVSSLEGVALSDEAKLGEAADGVTDLLCESIKYFVMDISTIVLDGDDEGTVAEKTGVGIVRDGVMDGPDAVLEASLVTLWDTVNDVERDTDWDWSAVREPTECEALSVAEPSRRERERDREAELSRVAEHETDLDMRFVDVGWIEAVSDALKEVESEAVEWTEGVSREGDIRALNVGVVVGVAESSGDSVSVTVWDEDEESVAEMEFRDAVMSCDWEIETDCVADTEFTERLGSSVVEYVSLDEDTANDAVGERVFVSIDKDHDSVSEGFLADTETEAVRAFDAEATDTEWSTDKDAVRLPETSSVALTVVDTDVTGVAERVAESTTEREELQEGDRVPDALAVGVGVGGGVYVRVMSGDMDTETLRDVVEEMSTVAEDDGRSVFVRLRDRDNDMLHESAFVSVTVGIRLNDAVTSSELLTERDMECVGEVDTLAAVDHVPLVWVTLAPGVTVAQDADDDRVVNAVNDDVAETASRDIETVSVMELDSEDVAEITLSEMSAVRDDETVRDAVQDTELERSRVVDTVTVGTVQVSCGLEDAVIEWVGDGREDERVGTSVSVAVDGLDGVTVFETDNERDNDPSSVCDLVTDFDKVADKEFVALATESVASTEADAETVPERVDEAENCSVTDRDMEASWEDVNVRDRSSVGDGESDGNPGVCVLVATRVPVGVGAGDTVRVLFGVAVGNFVVDTTTVVEWVGRIVRVGSVCDGERIGERLRLGVSDRETDSASVGDLVTDSVGDALSEDEIVRDGVADMTDKLPITEGDEVTDSMIEIESLVDSFKEADAVRVGVRTGESVLVVSGVGE
jgi:hypothetical protein